jgi:hypothetical protein
MENYSYDSTVNTEIVILGFWHYFALKAVNFFFNLTK